MHDFQNLPNMGKTGYAKLRHFPKEKSPSNVVYDSKLSLRHPRLRFGADGERLRA